MSYINISHSAELRIYDVPSQNCILLQPENRYLNSPARHTRDKINSLYKETIFASACPVFRLVGGKSNARQCNGMGICGRFADSPPSRIRLTGWKLQPAGNFRRSSATATGPRERARDLGTSVPPSIRIPRSDGSVANRWIRLRFDAVRSVCRRRFEWIAPLLPPPRAEHKV